MLRRRLPPTCSGSWRDALRSSKAKSSLPPPAPLVFIFRSWFKVISEYAGFYLFVFLIPPRNRPHNSCLHHLRPGCAGSDQVRVGQAQLYWYARASRRCSSPQVSPGQAIQRQAGPGQVAMWRMWCESHCSAGAHSRRPLWARGVRDLRPRRATLALVGVSSSLLYGVSAAVASSPWLCLQAMGPCSGPCAETGPPCATPKVLRECAAGRATPPPAGAATFGASAVQCDRVCIARPHRRQRANESGRDPARSNE